MEQFFPLLMNEITGEVEDGAIAPDYLLAVYASQYLLALEDVCKLYMEGRVDDSATTSIRSQVKADIEGFLMYFYKEEQGTIEISNSVSVPWIHSDGRDASGELSMYPTTAACLADVGVTLKRKSTSLW